MKMISMSLGSWFPKTGLHMWELAHLLQDSQATEGLNKGWAERLRNELGLKKVGVIENEPVSHVYAQTDRFIFRYFSDGLLVVSGPAQDYESDRAALEEFYHEKLAPMLAYIFSMGAKGLEIMRSAGTDKRVYLLASDVQPTDLENLFGEDHRQQNDEGSLRFHSTKKLVIVETGLKDGGENVSGQLIDYAIFCKEVRNHARALLAQHRHIWGQSEQLVEQTAKVRASELPAINRQLVEYANTVGNIQYRLDQMRSNIEYRAEKWEVNGPRHESLVNFGHLKYTLDYLKSIFGMTARHLNNNVEHMKASYGEVQQKLLNHLQALFLVSTVVAFISLGAIPGAKLVFFNSQGQPTAYGDLISFDALSMVSYGIAAIAVTFVLYTLWLMMFQAKVKKTMKK